MSTTRVVLETEGPVAELTLVHAAIDPAWVQQFGAAVRTLASGPPGVRAVLVRAERSRFTVGGDLGHFTAHADRLAEEMDAMVGPFHAALADLGELPLPVVCAAQGAAAGGGLGLLYCADEVLLADDARLACGFARIGLSGDGGNSWALPRLVGQRRASQMLLGGRVLDAHEALEWGLADEVVPSEELAARARERARRMAAGPTAAYGRMRRALRSAWTASWREQLEAEHAAMVASAATADAAEGIASFVERRDPEFQGG